jgi:hypothetical protein
MRDAATHGGTQYTSKVEETLCYPVLFFSIIRDQRRKGLVKDLRRAIVDAKNRMIADGADAGDVYQIGKERLVEVQKVVMKMFEFRMSDKMVLRKYGLPSDQVRVCDSSRFRSFTLEILVADFA